MPVADGFFPPRMRGYAFYREIYFNKAFGVAVYHLFFAFF